MAYLFDSARTRKGAAAALLHMEVQVQAPQLTYCYPSGKHLVAAGAWLGAPARHVVSTGTVVGVASLLLMLEKVLTLLVLF